MSDADEQGEPTVVDRSAARGDGSGDGTDAEVHDPAGRAGSTGLVNPELVPEYLGSLQDGLDAMQDRAERLEARVAKLEDDREVLRGRLADARRQLEERRGAAGVTRLLRRAGRVLTTAGGADPTSDAPSAPAGDATSAVGGSAAPAEAAGGAVDGPALGGAVSDEPATATLPVVGRIGPVEWPAPDPVGDLRVALVADEFTRTALAHEADVLELHAPTALEELTRRGADLLLVESAYTGPGRTWQRRIARFGRPHDDVVRLVEGARDLGVPTVFWNKEDPVNSDWFTATAALFDHVLTVDADLVDTYRARFGHDRVGVLPFAAQPAIHRPPDDPSDRVGPILFAGTWFATKHAARREQMSMLLDPARERGLHVLSRHTGDPRFAWPERFREHVVGSLPYPLAVEATRRYRVVVNVNTVTDSPTMCARRVFELACAATPVVSGPSRAVEEMVPAEAIRVAHTSEEAAAAYDELLGSASIRAVVGDAARQWVLDGHTWSHRLEELVVVAGT